MLALIDYGSGNIRSVHKAFAKIGGNIEIITTNDPNIIKNASRIVLPGVGAYSQCIDALKAIDGMIEALEDSVLKKGVPFLGICVGMQLLSEYGIEFQTAKGLGWIKGEVSKLAPNNHDLKVPHMGWDEVVPNNCKLFELAWNNKPNDVYFANSFGFRAKNNKDIAATCTYGADTFAAAVQKDNILGLQFHPEKSQNAGLKILKTWLEL